MFTFEANNMFTFAGYYARICQNNMISYSMTYLQVFEVCTKANNQQFNAGEFIYNQEMGIWGEMGVGMRIAIEYY